jgi:hypothetical protein
MVYAIEHASLDGGIVYHILENDLLAYLQGMIEAP